MEIDTRVIKLTHEECLRLVELLNEPNEPNEKLKAAAADYNLAVSNSRLGV